MPSRCAAGLLCAAYLVAALPLCAAGPGPGHGAHRHAAASGEQHSHCHEPAQLDAPCPCGCDDDDPAGVSGVRLGVAEPGCAPAPDPLSSLRAWFAPGPRLPAEPDLGIDPVPI